MADHRAPGFPSQFAADMARRRVLAGIATGLGGALLAACGKSARAQGLASAASCPVTPEEIRGPYPADGVGGHDRRINVLVLEGVERADIRASFAGVDGEAPGVPMAVELELVAAAAACAPLAGHAVYLWQCDAAGDYSLYTRREVNYLRGVQVADANGKVRFTSIVPGCYGGRAPHLHLEVFASLDAALSGAAPLLVSQLGLPQEPCDAVYADRAVYGTSAANHARWNVARDWAFRGENRAHMILDMNGDPATGYRSTARISLS